LAQEDNLSVNIELGIKLNESELAQTRGYLAELKKSIESINNSRLSVQETGRVGGNPLELMELSKVLPKAISGGDKSSFKKIQIGLYNKLDENLADHFGKLANVFIDDLNKSTGETGVASKAFLPAVEKINSAIDAINNRVVEIAKVFDLPLNREQKFDIISKDDIKKLTNIGSDFINLDTSTVEKVKDQFMNLSLEEMANSGGQISNSVEVMSKVLKALNINLKTDVDKLADMLTKLEEGSELSDAEVAAAFDFKAVGKKASTLALSPAMFESLFNVIIEELGQYIQNGNVFKGFGDAIDKKTLDDKGLSKYDKNLLRYESSRDPKAALFQKDRFSQSSDLGLKNFYKTLNGIPDSVLNHLMDELGVIANKKLEAALINSVKAFGKSLAGSADFKAAAKEAEVTGQSIEGYVAMHSNINNLSNNFENFKQIVTEQEQLSGFLPGTLGANVDKLDINELLGDQLTMLPQGMVKEWLVATFKQATAEVITHIKDSSGNIVETLNIEEMMKAALPEAGAAYDHLIPQIAKRFQSFIHPYDSRQLDPLTQGLMEPGIFTKGLNSEKESSVKGSVTKLLKARLERLNKEIDDSIIESQATVVKEQLQLGAGKKQLAIGTGKSVSSSEYDLGKFGAVFPDLDKLRTTLEVIGNGLEAIGQDRTTGMDTEFNNMSDEILTEAAIVVKDANDNFIELFKMMSLPSDKVLAALAKVQPDLDLPKNSKEVGERADRLGIPREFVGSPTDKQLNFEIFEKNLRKLSEVLAVIDQSGFSVSMYNKGSDTSAVTNAIQYANKTSGKSASELIPMPGFKNTYDLLKELSKLKESSDQLREIIPEVGDGQRKLTNVLNVVYSARQDDFKKFENQFTMGKNGPEYVSSSGAKVGAHTAATDAVGMLIVQGILKALSDRQSLFSANIVPKNSAGPRALSSGGGFGEPPKEPPAASGDKPSDDDSTRSAKNVIARIFNTQKEYKALFDKLTADEERLLWSKLQGLRKDSEAIQIESDLQNTEKKLVGVNKELLELKRSLSEKEIKNIEARVRSAGNVAANPAVGTIPNKAKDAVIAGLPGITGTLEDYLRKQMGPLTKAQYELSQQFSGTIGPLTQVQQRYSDQIDTIRKLSVEKINLTQAGIELEKGEKEAVLTKFRGNNQSEKYTKNLTKEIDANLANAQAGKAATNQIKAQLQEQVAGQKAVQKQTQSLMNTWVTSRYALYDVGNFYQSVAQNLIRVSREIFNTSQSYRNFETSFTSVERAMQLTGDAAVDLRDQFIKLSEEFPISFEEISRIATLGAQMGIAADGVVDFTQTVAKFSTITGISADTVAQKFGKIAELADVDPSQFENLGSAVAFAGINAVATESEILTLSESIAAVANQSGITAPEIIGIATALASVGVPAEQARGVFTRVFADLDRAASVGGDSLANFASVAGMSAQEFAGSWGKEGEANSVFIALLEGLNASDNLTATFDKLNIVETREINTLTRLAKNLDVVRQALGDSNVSFADATFLGDSFGKTADNLDAKIVVFKNNVDSLAAAFSGTLAESLKTLLDFGSGFLNFLKGASDSPIFKLAGPVLASTIALGAGFALLASIVAKTTAQVYALRVAMINAANSPMVVSGIAGQVKALTGIGSGIIEMRDKVSGINEKGLIEPVDYSNLIAGEKGHAKELLEKKNIYLALGTEMEGTEAAAKAGANTRIQLARLEAEQFTNEIAKKVAAIKAEEIALDQLVIAEKTATGAQKEMLASKIAEKTVDIENMKNTKLYTTIHAGQVKVINADTLATYKNTVATKAGTIAEQEEAAARAASAKQVNLNSVSAVTGIEKIGSVLSKVVGFVSVIGIVITAVDMLYNAFANLNKVDLTLAGGGTESLREAIKKDTQAVQEGTMEAVTTAKIGYTELTSGVDKAAVAINRLTGTESLATKSMKYATESANEQTIAIGENTKVWLANAIAKDEGLKNIDFTEVQQNMEALGMNFDTVLRDMVSAANGAKINPLANVDKELALVQEAMRKRNEEIIDPNNPNSAYAGMFDEEYKALEDRKRQLEDVKTSLQGIKPAFEAAFGDTRKFDAIFNALGIGRNAILDLSDALAEATSSGTGMEDVLLQVQNAVIEVAGITSEGDLLKIRTSSSIQALRDVIATMYEAALAADTLRNVSISDLQQDRAMAARSNSKGAQAAVDAITAQINAIRSGTSGASKEAQALKDALTSIDSILAGSGGDNDNADGAGSPEAKIRTLTDYANELKSVLQAAFDIRYQKQIGLDAITSSWINITKAAEDAKKTVKSANEEINQTNADREVLLYQLSVAERYGDEKRAAVIRAKLAKLDSQLLSQQEQLAEANNAGSKTLTGNSKAAIDNRSQVRDLVTQYNSYLTALANSGMSSEELQTQAAALEQEFLNQGEALGFSREELGNYTNAFKNDFTTVIKNLPRNITLQVDTDPAMRAIKEFVAQASAALSTVGVGSISSGPAEPEPQTLAQRVQLIRDNFTNTTLMKEIRKRSGATSGSADSMASKIENYLATITRTDADSLLALIGLSRGGFVNGAGTSTSDSIPAMLSRGEYVIKASSVGAYGLDFMNALNQQRVGFTPASQVASANSSSSSSVVYLSPEDRALLRSVVDRPIALYTENSKIAQSANAGNVLLAQRGSN
jgi:TP901 family phage tail tape measure protein